MDADAPAWAKGQDLSFLREVAAIFKRELKKHTYGAFGVPKERDIADALVAQSLVFTRMGGPDVRAAAIGRLCAQASRHEDFSGRAINLRAGDLFLSRVAGEPDGVREIIHKLQARHAPGAFWIEAHVEHTGLAALLAEEGFARLATKISASSDLHGLYCLPCARPAPIVPPLDPADEPGVAVLSPGLLSAGKIAELMVELWAHGRGAFQQHYSGYNKGKTWTAFSLKGYDAADPGFIIKPAEMSRAWKAENQARLAATCEWTTAAPHFPLTRALVDSIPGEKQRVRFMRLSAAGGELTRHADITDPEAGTADGKIARLHIPLLTDPACYFRSWRLDGAEERLHMPAGALCYIDTRKPHAVVNPAASERIHLVLDTYSTPRLRLMIANGKGRP